MKVFISYRRADLGGKAREFVGRLYDELAARWGKENIFLDVDTIPAGVLFTDYIAQQVARADVMLEIIGPQWARELRERHWRKDDFVRIEIESATVQAIPVLPVLVNGTRMPSVSDIVPRRPLIAMGRKANPVASEAILKMLFLNAHQLREGGGFKAGVARLVADLEEQHVLIPMIWCPPGKFMMGNPEPEKGKREIDTPLAAAIESPFLRAIQERRTKMGTQHEVTLRRGFWIGKYPVTQAQWEKVIGINPSDFKGPANPVECVSWEDAMVFCKRLSAREGVEYRLPTEAEWEYACRAGSTAAFCFGDDEVTLGDYAWFEANSDAKSHPVGLKKPNAWGIHDMHGNVFEWCHDWHAEYPAAPATDPKGAASGDERVYRGGSWMYLADSARSADRGRETPSLRISHLGFRLARSAHPGS